MTPRCTTCGALRGGEGLFCSFCGSRAPLAGVRLLEAIAIEVVGDAATPLIPYGAPLPASYSDTFGVSADGQGRVSVHLVLGNAAQASANRSFARLTVPLSRRLRRGDPAVRVTLRVEASGRTAVAIEELEGPNRSGRDDLLVAVSARPEAG